MLQSSGIINQSEYILLFYLIKLNVISDAM